MNGQVGCHRQAAFLMAALPDDARTGCQWRAMPHDLPPGRIVYWYFMA